MKFFLHSFLDKQAYRNPLNDLACFLGNFKSVLAFYPDKDKVNNVFWRIKIWTKEVLFFLHFLLKARGFLKFVWNKNNFQNAIPRNYIYGLRDLPCPKEPSNKIAATFANISLDTIYILRLIYAEKVCFKK